MKDAATHPEEEKAEVRRRQIQEGSFRNQSNEAAENRNYTQPETEARAEGQS